MFGLQPLLVRFLEKGAHGPPGAHVIADHFEVVRGTVQQDDLDVGVVRVPADVREVSSAHLKVGVRRTEADPITQCARRGGFL